MIDRRVFSISLAAASLSGCQQGAGQHAAAPGALMWRNAPTAPYAVQEIYPALYRGGIWIAGGFAPQAALGATQRVIVFDVASNAWREGPALPQPSHHVHLAALNDELWAIGGFLGGDTRTGWICTSRVLKLSGDTWIDGPTLPRPVGEAAPIVHLDRIHLLGGRSPRGAPNAAWNDHADIDDHFVIGVGDVDWTRAASLPVARNSSAGVSDGERVHVISGRTVTGGQTPRHDIYDPRSGQMDPGKRLSRSTRRAGRSLLARSGGSGRRRGLRAALGQRSALCLRLHKRLGARRDHAPTPSRPRRSRHRR